MKMQILSLAMVMMIATGLFGQKTHKREKIEAMKVAFITNEVQLTPEESEQFWPLYHSFHKELKALKSTPVKRPDPDKISEDEAREILEQMMKKERELLELKHNYIQKTLTILPPKKVLKLIIANKKFKRKLLKEVAKNKKRKGPRKHGK